MPETISIRFTDLLTQFLCRNLHREVRCFIAQFRLGATQFLGDRCLGIASNSLGGGPCVGKDPLRLFFRASACLFANAFDFRIEINQTTLEFGVALFRLAEKVGGFAELGSDAVPASGEEFGDRLSAEVDQDGKK